MSIQALPPAEPLADSVARRVRGLMGEFRISGRTLALQMGMTQQALSRRTTGVTPFRLDEVSDLARALGVSESYLLGFTPERGDAPGDTDRYLARADSTVIALAPFLARRASLSRQAVAPVRDTPARVLRFAPVARLGGRRVVPTGERAS